MIVFDCLFFHVCYFKFDWIVYEKIEYDIIVFTFNYLVKTVSIRKNKNAILKSKGFSSYLIKKSSTLSRKVKSYKDLKLPIF